MPPSGTEAEPGATDTEILTTVIAAEAALVGSVTEVAVSVTVAFAGIAGGAVYAVGVPLAVLAGEIVPQPGEHEAPFWVRAQVTPPLSVSLPTVGVNCTVEPIWTFAEVGDTDTVIGPVRVRVAEADLVVSVTEVAVTVTVAGEGWLAGAV
jgi:hypothetical protein